jgi:CheY-like chemotaxis protein
MREQIMVVNHIEDRRENLGLMLEEHGMSVIQAASCEEGLSLLAEKSVKNPRLRHVPSMPGSCLTA